MTDEEIVELILLRLKAGGPYDDLQKIAKEIVKTLRERGRLIDG